MTLTSDAPSTAWRVRAPRALNNARASTLVHRREAKEPCTNATKDKQVMKAKEIRVGTGAKTAAK